MRIASLTLLVATLTSGCAQVYVPPAPENRAFLRIAPPIDVFGYLDNGNDCSGARRFDDADNPFKRADRILVVPAGRRVAINFAATGPGISACNVLLAFSLQPGARYEARMTLSPERCLLQIVESGKDPAATAATIGLKQVRPGSCAPL